ncbi:MAG TPA: KTSC domain-containing protein [Solirubrobacteraceae bacterium]|jgi:lysyl-tRNA synthetase class 2
MPRLQRVESSWIAAIGYDHHAQEVYVELIEGGTYAYRSVPAAIWHDFESAPSKGTFVNEVLKDGYAFREA